MATRLESGNVQVRQVGGVPMQHVNQQQTNYMFAANAQAQEANTLARILDDMSNSIGEYAAKKRFEEGLQFAAENPLTPEQLQIAKEGLPSAIPGVGKISSEIGFFGKAVQKARSLELSSHFEVEGRNELTKLLADVQAGTVTSDQVGAKIATMTEGYAKSLASVDPEASLKFRATMATHGNTVLNAAYEAELKRAKAQRIAKFDMDFDNVTRLIEAAVSQAPDKIDALADVHRKNIITQSLLLGDAAIQKEYSTKFETVLRNAKINALTKEFTDDKYMADPMATLGKIRNGDAGKLSPVLKSLTVTDFDAVAKVTANYMVAVNNRESIAKEKRAEQKRADTKELIPLLDRAYALPENSAERRKLADQVAVIAERNPDAVPLGVIKDLREPNKEGNPVAEFNALTAIYEGRITSPGQIASIPGLNGKQKVCLLKTLTSEDRRDQRDLDTGLARLAGIPTMPGQVTVLDPKGAEFQRLQQLRASAQFIQAEATAKGEVVTPRQVLERVGNDLEKRRNTEQAKAARNSLTTVWEKKAGGPITRDSLPALERTGKLKPAEITQIKKLLDQAEGGQ